MQSEITVAHLQMPFQGDDQEKNRLLADEYCRKAAEAGADIALFPEMWNIGYLAFTETTDQAVEAWKATAIDRDSSWFKHFQGLAKELDMAIAVTYLEKLEGRDPRNSVSLIDRHGKVLFTYAKVHTCDFGFEAACTAGDDWYVAELDTRAGAVQVGAMICYDREYPESARTLMIKGAEIILTPNACPLDDMRLHQFQARAFENATAMFMTNYGGDHYLGRSVAYNGDGQQISLIGADGDSAYSKVDLKNLRQYRSTCIWGNSYRKPHRYGNLLRDDVAPEFQRKDGFGKEYRRQER